MAKPCWCERRIVGTASLICGVVVGTRKRCPRFSPTSSSWLGSRALYQLQPGESRLCISPGQHNRARGVGEPVLRLWEQNCPQDSSLMWQCGQGRDAPSSPATDERAGWPLPYRLQHSGKGALFLIWAAHSSWFLVAEAQTSRLWECESGITVPNPLVCPSPLPQSPVPATALWKADPEARLAAQ